MSNHSDDRLDEVLNSALREYSSQEPWPGLERRVLGRLPAPTRSRAWFLAPALCMGLIAAVILFRSPERRETAPARPPAAAENHARPPSGVLISSVPTEQSKSYSAPRPVRRTRRPAAPAPLSPGERALLRLAVFAPDELGRLQKSTEAMNAPLSIEPLKIEPLSMRN